MMIIIIIIEMSTPLNVQSCSVVFIMIFEICEYFIILCSFNEWYVKKRVYEKVNLKFLSSENVT